MALFTISSTRSSHKALSSNGFSPISLRRNSLLTSLWQWNRERFTPAGRWLAGATVAFALTGASSLEMQFYPAFIYAATVWIVASLTSRRRPRVVLKARHAPRIASGETLAVEIEIEALRRHGELNVAPRRLPPGLEVQTTHDGAFAPLAMGEKARAQIGLKCARRGVYALNGWDIESDFPLGLLRTRQSFTNPTTLRVLPQFVALQALNLPFLPAHEGVAVASRVGASFEILGNRDWRDGDSRRDINWRATARSRKTVVREMCQERWPRANIILDTFVARPRSQPFTRRKTGNATDEFERAVSLCASVTDFMARHNYVVELFAAGAHILHLDAQPDSSQLDAILDVLAEVQSAPSSQFESLAAALQLRSAPTTICFLLDWDAPRRDFIRQLRRQECFVKVVIVRQAATTLALEDENVVIIDDTRWQNGVNRL